MSDDIKVAPVQNKQRHQSLDALRGFALLGILSINILGFGLPGMAFMFPSVAGGTEGANFTAWAITEMYSLGSMRTLFSMMFGAGVVLLTSRMFERGQGELAADIYYRRTIWLLALGLVDGYLFLWWGDILFGYALVGLFLYPLRNVSAKKLMITATIILSLISLPRLGILIQGPELIAQAREAQVIEADGGELTEEQTNALNQYNSFAEMIAPPQEDIDAQVEAMQGGYGSAISHVSKDTYKYQWKNAFPGIFIDVLMMMLFGMAFIKKGILTLECKTKTYALFLIFGYGFGFAMRSFDVMKAAELGLGVDGILFSFVFMEPSRFALAMGHIGLIMLMLRSGVFGWLMAAFAAVGRMALSNYLMQSIICAFIFYGIGFGLYGTLERHELYPIMAGIWAFQIIFSVVWMKMFRFGPFEWVWRSLTYNKRQPMRH